jgi:transcriptional regulator with XRE-family HTH domain
MADNKKLLGQKVRQLRKQHQYSQERFAEMLGIDPNSVSRIECGVYYPSLDTLERIAKILKVELRDLFLFSNKESAEELRTYLVQTASELDVEKLREVVRAVRKIV